MATSQYRYEFSLWHTEHDTNIALDIASILEEKGYRGFVEHRDGAAGVQAIVAADDVIQSSRVSILLLSPRFMQESWCKWVSHWCLVNAIEQNTARVIPVYVDLKENKRPDTLNILPGIDYKSKFFSKKLLNTMKSKMNW